MVYCRRLTSNLSILGTYYLSLKLVKVPSLVTYMYAYVYHFVCSAYLWIYTAMPIMRPRLSHGYIKKDVYYVKE